MTKNNSQGDNGENKMEKVTLIPTDENSRYFQQHVASRHGKGSTTIGSKLLENVQDGYMLNLLKETDKKYQKLIDEKGEPGRVVFAVEADRPVGTNAIFPIENVDQSLIFSTIREPGTERAAKIKVVLVSEKDIPTTNVAQVIMGSYGENEKGIKEAGNYTVIFGDEGMPFPESVAKRNPDDKELIGKCQKYWDSHVMLITPKELEANITELKAQGMPTKTQELALKTFLQHRGGKSPIIKSFTPEISPNAVKLKLSKSNNITPKTYE